VPAAQIDESGLRRLRRLFASCEGFDIAFRDCRRFSGVLWLAPEPDTGLRDLTDAVRVAYPSYLPYEGEFGTSVPHLTAAQGEERLLDEAEIEIRARLPITSSVRTVTLFEEIEPEYWKRRAAFPLRA
jgi:hypothetical protein